MIAKYFSFQNVINLLLRGLSIGGRFLLILLITYKFSPVELGVYGIFNTSIILGVQLIGFDYYVYTSRELLKDGVNRMEIIWNQFLFQGVTYVLAIPAIIILFSRNFLDWSFVFIFYFILLLEHISGEQYRLLILFSRSTHASVLLFMKSALWIFLIPILWLLVEEQFYYIFICWVIGLMLSLGYGFYYLREDLKGTHFKYKPEIVKKALMTSLPFFISTILLKVTEYSSRYIIDDKLGKGEVGIFTFYSNFANVLSTVVFTLVIMTQYPLVIKAFLNNSIQERLDRSRKLLKDSIIMPLLLSPVILGAVWYFVSIYKTEIYFEGFSSFVVLVIMNIFVCINYATHYILFGKQKDSWLIVSYFLGSVISLSFSLFLIPAYKLMGASLAGLLGFITIVGVQFFGIWVTREKKVWLH